VVIDQIAMVANDVAAEDAVEVVAVAAAEAKAGIVRAQRIAERRWVLVRRRLGQTTRLPRKPRPCRKVTVLIAMKTWAMRTLGTLRLPKRLASGSRTIVHPHSRNSGRRNRSTRRRNLSTGHRCLHHNM
jgi:hypothetical protein